MWCARLAGTEYMCHARWVVGVEGRVQAGWGEA